MKTGLDINTIHRVISNSEFKGYEITNVEEGVSTDVFRLSKNSIKLYLRVLPKEEKALLQVIAHRKMKEKNITVPEVLSFEEDVALLENRSYMVVSEIAGASIKSSNLSKNEKEKVIIEAGKQIALVNSINVKGVGWIDDNLKDELIANGSNYDDFAINNLSKMLNDLENQNIVPKDLSKKVFNYIMGNKVLFDIQDSSFLAHGDFGVDHIYQNNGNYSGIIDFGDIRGTTKFHDMSHIYTFDGEFFNSLVYGYKEVFQLPDDYLERVKLESVLFGVGKLWWVAKSRPDKLKDHPVLKLFSRTLI